MVSLGLNGLSSTTSMNGRLPSYSLTRPITSAGMVERASAALVGDWR